eukprot:scaffold107333_cov51-Phaeocystis_antarctica.AAC.1
MSWKDPSRMAESICCSRYSASTSEMAVCLAPVAAARGVAARTAGAAGAGARRLVRGSEGAVDLRDQGIEEPLVGRLGEGVPRHIRLPRRARHLAPHDDLGAQCACKLLEGTTEQLGGGGGGGLRGGSVAQLGASILGLVLRRRKVDLPQVQRRSHHTPVAHHGLVVHAAAEHGGEGLARLAPSCLVASLDRRAHVELRGRSSYEGEPPRRRRRGAHVPPAGVRTQRPQRQLEASCPERARPTR